MADVTIESIAIEITAAADSADKALERLSKNLETLRSVCASGLEGANKVADGLKKIAEAANYFNSVDEGKMKSVASALRAIGKIESVPNLTPFARSIAKVVEATNSVSTEQMTSFVTNMRSFSSAMQPLSSLLGLGDLSGAINALKGLPKVAKGLSQMNLGTFAQQMQQITTAIQPFVTQMQNLSSSFTNMPAPIQQAVAGIVNYNTAVNNADDRTRSLGKSLKLLNFTAMYFAIRKVVNILGKFITSSNEYVENLNLFHVTMGETADEALEFANTVNKVMGIDVSQWIKNQGVFKQMTSGFGMVEEKANLVSKNLTQLGYDISSYFNISVEDSMQKLQAGLAGEIEPLRRLGYALDAATLQQVAHAHGIEMNINNMSQAQKAQLRYIAIMEQSTNAMGDMARTIDSPANQLRILESRIETLKRAIGDSLMPVVSAALPYVTAFVQIVGEAFRGLAEFMGFELPEFDYSDVMTKQNEDIASSFDEATKASKEFKGTLASIDQLNIIGSKSEKGAGTGNNFGADLDLNLPSYDFLGNLKEETSQAYNTLKDFLAKIAPVAKTIAGVLATMFVIKKTSDLVNAIKNIASAFKAINSTMIGKIATGITAGVGAFILLKNTVKGLVTGNGSIWGLVGAIAAVGVAVTAFIAVGNPLGAVITGIGAAVGIVTGLITGWIENQKELNEQLAQEIVYANDGGIALEGLADGFSGYFDTITDGYDDIIANSDAMQANRDKIEAATKEIENITEKYRLMGGEMSAEKAETIKENIETIGNAVSENLGTFTQSTVDTLKDKFSEFATQLGQDVDDMCAKFYLLESMGNTALANVKKHAGEIVDEIMSGNLTTEEMNAKMQELNETVKQMGGSTTATAESIGFTQALQDMDFASINFQNEEEVKNIVSSFSEKAKAAREKIEEARNKQLLDLQNTKQQYINLGVDVKFDAQFGTGEFAKLFENTEKVLKEGYASELKKIDTGEGTFYAMLQNQYDKSTEDFIWEKYKDTAEEMGLSRDEAMERLKASGYFKAFASEFTDTDTAKAIQDTINNAAAGLDFSQYTQVGEYLLEGMANGAIKGQEDLNKALDAASNGAIDEVKRICGIHSPSTVFAEIGDYLMQGLGIGITKNMRYPLNALDEVTKEMHKQMSNVSLSVPVYTEGDVNKVTNGVWRGAWRGGMQPMAQPQYQGADPQALTHASQIWSANGQPMDVNVNVQSYVELDGEQVGTAVSRYQQRQMAYSNGR